MAHAELFSFFLSKNASISFNVPFRMILNRAIGGDWAGAKGIDDAAMPQRMEIDYVRVWQRR